MFMGMIGQNETKSFKLEKLSTYIFTEAGVSNGDISSKAEVALIITGNSSNNVSSIIWLSRYNNSINPTVRGLTFSLAMPNNMWGAVTFAKLI